LTQSKYDRNVIAVRYPRDHKQRTRRRILAAAAQRFRKKGFRGAGVDGVMNAAGLTAGGFYAHFPSKRALLADVLRTSLEETRLLLFAGLDQVEGPAWLRGVVGKYLSRAHRDDPGGGCALPSLSADVAREGKLPREALQAYVRQLAAELAPRTPAAPDLVPEDRVLATIALLSGALTLARAVEDPELSDRILRAARRLAVPELAVAAEAEGAARIPGGEP
jgi:TetR/AcrR family transcriptional repressor of nem operon